MQQDKKLAPNNVLSVAQGTLILWLAWLMFNGGSSLAIVETNSSDAAQLAIVNTILSPAVGGMFTFFTKKHILGGEAKETRLDLIGLTNGILAGLVAITAGCDCVEPWAALIIGCLGSITYTLGVKLMSFLKVDDPIEAFQVHGCCGFMGCIFVAIFKKDEGLLYGAEGSGKLLGVQLLGAISIFAWSFTVTAIFFVIGNALGAVRMTEKDEIMGGDIYYFNSIKFDGKVNQYDLHSVMKDKVELHQIMTTAKKLNED
mmetsp:Transcript_12413/g.20855  ORF Transcript_12413/g.20855 Transcript_12413/m.20855 type:complete len:258 (+) Transcript_12413:823-1596(+)